MTGADAPLSRQHASEAIAATGWRYLLGNLAASVPVNSLGQAVIVADAAITACGEDADRHLRVDLRPDRVELALLDKHGRSATVKDTMLAAAITAALDAVDAIVATPVSTPDARPVQMLEIAIDAMDIAAIRPFWKAVLGYVDEAGHDGPEDPIIDPARQLPAVWFQQMDGPRPQRNRIHFDITVAHDEADTRIRAALDAGGVLVSDARARAYWVLADAEGNEACVCTWLDRAW